MMAAALLAACPTEQLPADLGDCPDNSTMTWTVAEPLFAEHCAGCHSSQLITPAERQNATEGVNFDTAEGARAQDWLAWSQVRTGAMPQDGPLSPADALLLWEWWSCGGPD